MGSVTQMLRLILVGSIGFGAAQSSDLDKWPFPGANTLTTVHPGYDLDNLRPAGFEPQVSGMGFLKNGDLALVTYNKAVMDVRNNPGDAYILSGVQTGDKSQVVVKKVITGLWGPMGLTVVNDDIYVIGTRTLMKLKPTTNGTPWTYDNISPSWERGKRPFSFEVQAHDGFFYTTFGGIDPPVKAGAQDITGAAVKISPDGKMEVLCRGLRSPNGLGFNLEGDLFVTDHQGDWLPANKLINVKAGRFYGHQDSNINKQIESPPAIYIPQGDAGLSPSSPVVIPSGVFADQFLIGDVRYGNVHRAFLEKVKGEYQGSLFHFTGGLEAGIHRMVFGPDGNLYLGGLGSLEAYQWNWNNKLFGFQRMRLNGKPYFEMVAIRARTGGLEVEFTEPVNALGRTAGGYALRSWYYKPTSDYGGPKMDPKDLVIKSATASADGKRVFLEIPGLEEGRVVWLRLNNALKSEAGRDAWTFESWYTLNHFGETAPFSGTTPIVWGRPEKMKQYERGLLWPTYSARSSAYSVTGALRRINTPAPTFMK